MKKIIATLSVAALTALGANAQEVLGYSITQEAGTYTPLSSPTVVFDGSNTTIEAGSFEQATITPAGLATESGTTTGFPIGFTATVGGESYTHFLINPAGSIYLGNGEITHDIYIGPYFQSDSDGFTMFGMGTNYGTTFNADTKISYQTLGTEDEPYLVVQFENYGINPSFWGDPAYVDMQLILTPQGLIKTVFNDLGNMPEDETEIRIWMGVRKGGNYVCAYSDEEGTLTTVRNKREQLPIPKESANGTTYVWNTPGLCITPSTQPTELNIVRTSDSLEGTFVGTDEADTYLVTYSTGDAVPAEPETGVMYAENDKIGENTTVAYFGPDTEFYLYDMPGSTTYNFVIYATNSYGKYGPQYNVVDPLKLTVATLPAPPAEVKITESTLNSISLDVTSNATDDDVIVVYNTYCDRNNYGDRGLFGEMTIDTKAGDVLAVPEGFTPMWEEIENVPMPENAGIVAYAGKAGETITIENLAPSTHYFIGVYTRNAAGDFTSLPVFTGSFTTLQNPYDGDAFNFPRYELTHGWTTSPDDEQTFAFLNDACYDWSTGMPNKGTNYIQPVARLSYGDATNGKEAWLTSPAINVNDRHVVAKFDYFIVAKLSRFQQEAYNEWAEGDVLELRVSEDDGATWTTLATYTTEEHPAQVDMVTPVSISADLNDYRDKTVKVQLYWKTFQTPGFGATFNADRFSLSQAEFPAVPEVTVSKVTDSTAIASWVSKQKDYELSYGVKDGNVSHVVTVPGATTYTMEGLEANTVYVVKVRGLIVDEETGEETGWSEWSDPVEFTTADYPEVEAPQNLQADVETLKTAGYVILSWDKVAEAESYEVAYRLANSTEWLYTESTDPNVMITGLVDGEEYVWKVLANCTHDRTTAYSAQARFIAPITSGIDGVSTESVTVAGGIGFITVNGAEGLDIAIYNTNGTCVAALANVSAAERIELGAGMYVVLVEDTTYKVIVR